MKLPEQQADERWPLWEALSDLWLDTEVQDYTHANIARMIFRSPYSLAEAELIHRYEVVPAVSINLMSVAGDWAGFDREWLKERCVTLAERRGTVGHRIRCALISRRISFFTKGHWQKITLHHEALITEEEGRS